MDGYEVWIDLDKMGGSTLQAMAEAVEDAAVILMSVCRKYKESRNCRWDAWNINKIISTKDQNNAYIWNSN